MTQESKRLAVVIGNSEYQSEYLARIPNAVKDAEAIRDTLQYLGFEVTLGINQERKEILELFTKIQETWKNEASEIVVYCSGHGISFNGKIYFGPVDATKVNVDFIDENFLNMEIFIKVLLKYRKDHKRPIIVILDCCRSILGTGEYGQDPLRGILGESGTKTNNLAILYSTTEGHDALDGNSSDRNSPYTKLLLKNMVKDYTIDEIHGIITNSLHNNQVPWISHCLCNPYKFCRTKLSTIPQEVKERFYGVPHKNNDFVNRPKILAEIEATLNTKESNTLVLRGLGGMGKTQLMLHYCYLHRNTYEFIIWLEVESLVVTLESFHKLAVDLGFDEKSGKEEHQNDKIIELVCNWFKKRKGWLLLLNNANDTMATKLFDVLPGIGGNIILTTREYISSKRAKIITVGKMDEDEALSLLLRTVDMNSIDHKSARYLNAKKIVTELDSMALAVDLAHAYVESMSISFKDYLDIFKNQRDTLLSHQDKDYFNHYHHSLKTVWQLSFDHIRTQSPLAIDILEICAFLQPELIPTSLFKQQHSVLALLSHISSSSTTLESDWKVWKAIQEAIAILAKFSFVTLTLNEDTNKAEGPSNDFMTIHRLVQKVIYDSMDDERRIRWTHKLASALNKEIDFSDSYSSLTRTTVNTYLLHIRNFVKMTNINQKALMSEDLFELMIHTVDYLLDNGIYFGVEELAQFALSISESIHKPESLSMTRSLTCLADLYHNQGYYNKAEPLYKRALVITEKVLGPEHPDTATSLNNLAGLYDDQGNYTEAEPLYERALAIFESVMGPEHSYTATSLNNLAVIYDSQRNYTKAEQSYKRAQAIFEKELGPEHPYTATPLNNLAAIYFKQGNYRKAEPLYERALVIIEKALGPEHRDTATFLNNLASLYRNQGKYGKAELLYKRALAIGEKALEPDHPSTASYLNNLAFLYFLRGNYGKAEPLYEQALVISEKALGPENSSTATFLNNLAVIYEKQGNLRKAEPLRKQALVIREKVLGPEHPDTVSSLNNLASLYGSQGKYSDAESLYQRVLIIIEKALGPEHPDTAASLNNLASLYVSQGKYSDAEQLYQRALIIIEKESGPGHPEMITSLSNLAGLYSNQGNYGKAGLLYKQALIVCNKALKIYHPEPLLVNVRCKVKKILIDSGYVLI